MQNNDQFGFCRSCGSPNLKLKSEDKTGKLWECQDCNRQFNEVMYESDPDDSQFVTGDLNGADIIHNKE